ncbi:MAG: P-II family nitrogen regulator [Gammaproteobacteria bacterium]
MTEIIYLTDLAIITCIVDKDRSDAVLLAARDVGARAATVHSAQSWGVRERFGILGVAVETEKDVIDFLVSSEQQDLIFDAIYHTAGLNAPGRGFMFISPVEKGAAYVPESVREKLGVEPE